MFARVKRLTRAALHHPLLDDLMSRLWVVVGYAAVVTAVSALIYTVQSTPPGADRFIVTLDIDSVFMPVLLGLSVIAFIVWVVDVFNGIEFDQMDLSEDEA